MANPYKRLLDLGQISQETYNKLNPEASITNTSMDAKPTSSPELSLVSGAVEGSTPESKPVGFVEEMQAEATPAVKGYVDKITQGPEALDAMKKEFGGKSGDFTQTGETPSILKKQQATPTEGDAQYEADAKLAEELQAEEAAAQAAQQAQAQASRDKLIGRGNALEGAFSAQQRAITKGAEAGAAQAAAESAYQQEMYDQTEAMRLRQEEREADRQAQLAERRGKLEQQIEEFSKLSVDPNRGNIFHNGTTGQKIAGGIALFLGSIGGATNGGQNAAVKVMENAINRDIEAQKVDIQTKGKALDASQSVYAKMMDEFGDARAADAASKLSYLQNAQIKLNQLASQYKGPQIQANAQALNAQIEQAKQKNMIEFETAMSNKIAQGQNIQGADALMSSIMRLPEKLQGKALEEKGILESHNIAVKGAEDLYSRGSEIGAIEGSNPLGEKKAELDGINANIYNQAASAVKGAMSDADFKEAIKPYYIYPTDTKNQIAKKKEAYLKFLSSNKKPTPILNGFGLTPKTSEQRGFKQDKK